MKVNVSLIAEDIQSFYGDQHQRRIARDLGVAQSTISNILSGRVKGLRPETVEKITKKIGTNPEKYIPLHYQTEWTELQVAEKFSNVSAYDLPTGVTYIGKLKESTLEEACMVPTLEIADGCNKLKKSAVEILRRYYEGMRANSALSSFQFSPLEEIARYELGNR